MPNKYIIHGATFNGNGTASNEATVDGGNGAWNSLNIFDSLTAAPAFGGGSLSAGDSIYIRAKDSSGADLVRTLNSSSITLGNANATSAAPITWIVDDGTIWPGIVGTLKYVCTSTYSVTLRNYNNYVALAQDKFVISEGVTNPNDIVRLTLAAYGTLSNIFIDLSYGSTSWGSKIGTTNAPGCVYLDSVHIKSYKRTTYLIQIAANAKLVFTNPVIELLDPTVTAPIFLFSQYGSRVELFGGVIKGTGATSGVPLSNISASDYVVDALTLVGTQYPKTMPLVAAYPTVGSSARLESFGNDGGAGSAIVANWGEAVSRSDMNHPALSAYLPDGSSSKWSWKIYPAAASLLKRMQMTAAKYFTGTAASKTITLQLLIGDGFTALNKSTLWMDVQYFDNATGDQKFVSSKVSAGTALDTSTRTWSIDPPSWGAVTLLKRSLSITTPTEVKPGTLVTCYLRGVAPSVSVNDLIFMCPDFELS